ncbi:MAG: nuclear transport factor 2 family protein [Melioribacteraceae bacterium]|nr:nuclear transport factor 2 family protein [Melioribacteraceae bacterium]
MKNLFLILFVLFSKISFAQDDFTAINSLKIWIDSFNSKNLEKTLSFISDEYIGYFPDQQDQFYDNIKDLYTKIFSNKQLDVTLKYFVNDFSETDSLTVVRLIITTTAKSTFSQQPQSIKEKGIQVWRKENNIWKLYRSVTFPINN